MSCVLGKTYHLVILFRSDIHEVIVDGILRSAVKPHFIMQVRTGRFTRIAYFGNLVASLALLTFSDIDFAKMGITGYVAISV